MLKKTLQDHQADVVHVGQFDYASVFRERRLRSEQFLQWAQDPRFGNVIALWDSADTIITGTSYFTEAQVIDPDSIRRYPAEPGAVAMICELAGGLAEVMPRMVLRRQLERAEAMGYVVDAGFEFEFILLDETDISVRDAGFENLDKFAPDNKCWSGTTAATHAGLIQDLEQEILDYDISLFGLGVELGPGCLEATLGATRGLRAADDAAFFRMAAQSWARRNELTASFMPYLGSEYPGIGGHVTLSLRDKSSGENLFTSTDGQTNDLAQTFIAGMIDVVPECFAMCTSSVNAYKRLAPGSWAPKALTWNEYTFTTAVRSVPSTNDTARLEFRCPPADCNPYLSMALMLGAGLDGIERGLSAPAKAEAAGPDDIPEGAVRFPRDLFDSAHRLMDSDTAKRLFGVQFVENFAAACLAEDTSLRTAVSSEERRRYLER
jgi:glutamine synthetase